MDNGIKGRQQGERGVPAGEAVRQAPARRKDQVQMKHANGSGYFRTGWRQRKKGETMEQIADYERYGEKTPRGADWTVAQVSLALSRWEQIFLKNR